MNQPVNADDVIRNLAQRIANLIVDDAVKDAHIAALTAERDELAALLPDEARGENETGSPSDSPDTA